MLWFGLAIITLVVVFGIFLGDWTDLGEVAVRCQRRARRTVAVAIGLMVVALVIIEIVSPIGFI